VSEHTAESDAPRRWWKYAVLRGEGIPSALDGRWYDLDETRDAESVLPRMDGVSATLDATNRWEQRESDGAVAVVYEWVRRPFTTRITPPVKSTTRDGAA